MTRSLGKDPKRFLEALGATLDEITIYSSRPAILALAKMMDRQVMGEERYSARYKLLVEALKHMGHSLAAGAEAEREGNHDEASRLYEQGVRMYLDHWSCDNEVELYTGAPDDVPDYVIKRMDRFLESRDAEFKILELIDKLAVTPKQGGRSIPPYKFAVEIRNALDHLVTAILITANLEDADREIKYAIEHYQVGIFDAFHVALRTRLRDLYGNLQAYSYSVSEGPEAMDPNAFSASVQKAVQISCELQKARELKSIDWGKSLEALGKCHGLMSELETSMKIAQKSCH